MSARNPGTSEPPTTTPADRKLNGVERSGSAAIAPVDPLEAIIPLLRPQVVLSKVISAAGDWSVRKPRYADPSFCLMLAGSCWLRPEGLEPIELDEGDFLLLPATPSFVLASDPTLTPVDLDLAPDQDSHYGDGDPTNPTSPGLGRAEQHRSPNPTEMMRMLGGYFRFDRANAKLLIELLPETILVRRCDPGSARLSRVVDLIAEEAIAQRPCREPILERLVEVLLIEACRLRAERPSEGERGLIAGLSDPQLAAVLRDIHDAVAEPWTVERLARRANMSRAVFAQRFTTLIGIPPMQYVLQWRVALAKDLLEREQLSVGEVADRIGYQSASAFTTAFTRVTGSSPREYVRTAAS